MLLFRSGRGAKALFPISNGFLRSHHSLCYSTISSNSDEAPTTHFMANYLVNSLGFSIGGAISTCSKNHGLSNEEIGAFITRKPRILTQNPVFLEGQLRWIVGELGIPEDSRMFIHAIQGVSMSSKSTLAKKFDIFRSYGWSDPEIITFGRTQPACLALSEAKLRNGLNFFMKELGYTPAFLASCPSLLGMSLEKRVKPRYRVWESLNEKKLIGSSPSFATLLSYPELKFLDFLKRYENEIPNLLETYNSSIRKIPS